jgi:hypothetical protein
MGMDASNRDYAESKMQEFFGEGGNDFLNHTGDGFGGAIDPINKGHLKLDAGLVPTNPGDWMHSAWRREI